MIQETRGMTGTDWQPVDLDLDWSFVRDEYAEGDREVLAWCKEYEGYGKFYHDTMFNLFYFERDEDREMFLLRWAK